MRTEVLPFKQSNKILETYRHFPYKPWYAIAELVDNSTQSYFDNREPLDVIYKKDTKKLEVRIDYDRQSKTLSVVDNAMGMDKTELSRSVLLARPPINRSGRSEFGMGMKTSCSWLGSVWSIKTSKLGSSEEYKVTIDIGQFASNESLEELRLEVREVPADTHYTIIEIQGMHHNFTGRQITKIKDYLTSMYRHDIKGNVMSLYWDGTELIPQDKEPLIITADGKTTVWKKDVAFTVSGKPVSGWVCILGDGQRGRANSGFDLIRRGRVIVGRPLGYRPENIFGDQRNDLKNQRLYGELHMDKFPVNHLKDDFIWEEFQDDFDEELKKQVIDYADFASKEFRPGKKGASNIPSDVKISADTEIADELSSQAMIEAIEIILAVPPPAPIANEVAIAEAEVLRQKSDAPRDITTSTFRVRIFHPTDMDATRRYMTHIAPEDKCLDIFINDNHPFVVREISDPAAYEAYTKTCVYDALAEWLARRIPDISPETIAHVKDQLMRAPGFE